MSEQKQQTNSRGRHWFECMTSGWQRVKTPCQSVLVADGTWEGVPTRAIAVVPDAHAKYPRAVHGEVGLMEGWSLGKTVMQAVEEDCNKTQKRMILAIIDVPSQAYGRREEAFGIHLALSAAANAYAKARQSGHPVVGLIVGKAMSGAFLAHGYQANRLVALNDAGVMVHAMGKASAARITLRTVEELEKLAETIAPMAYDVRNFATLGLLESLVDVQNPDAPNDQDLTIVRDAVTKALHAALTDTSLNNRLGAKTRASTVAVRTQMAAQW